MIHAQAAGVFMNVRKIGDLVEKCETIATIRTQEGTDIPVTAQISGILARIAAQRLSGHTGF